MKNNVLNAIENASIVLGLTISIDQINSILGIVLLAFQIGMIMYKVVASIVKHVKDKDYDKIDDDLQMGYDAIKVLKENNGNKQTNEEK